MIGQLTLGMEQCRNDEERDLTLSQWWTPEDLAAQIVADFVPARSWDAPPLRVLEPAAGIGRLVAPLLALNVEVVAYELDARWIPVLEELGAKAAKRKRAGRLMVHHGDYLAAESERFDLCLQNPPYENGADTDFMVKAAKEANEVVALVRTAARHGRGRHDRLWRYAPIRELRLLASRPSFGGGSPRHDFCVVRYGCDHEFGTVDYSGCGHDAVVGWR